jgi:hypothetical protein
LFDESFDLDHHAVRSYGSVKTFDSATMVLIDAGMIVAYPSLKK